VADITEAFPCGHRRRITIGAQCAECTVYPPPRAPGLPPEGLAYADADMLDCFSNWLAEMVMYGEPLSSVRRKVSSILASAGAGPEAPTIRWTPAALAAIGRVTWPWPGDGKLTVHVDPSLPPGVWRMYSGLR
jgi:hypothetical protein